jgi:hypothetical protein
MGHIHTDPSPANANTSNTTDEPYKTRRNERKREKKNTRKTRRKKGSSDRVSSLLQPTFRQTLLDAQGHIRWNHALDLIDVSAIDDHIATQSSGDDIRRELEKRIRRLLRRCILVVEGCHEDGRRTVRVELHVQRALREDVHLVEGVVVEDGARAVLEDHGGH